MAPAASARLTWCRPAVPDLLHTSRRIGAPVPRGYRQNFCTPLGPLRHQTRPTAKSFVIPSPLLLSSSYFVIPRHILSASSSTRFYCQSIKMSEIVHPTIKGMLRQPSPRSNSAQSLPLPLHSGREMRNGCISQDKLNCWPTKLNCTI